jgi:hypothetical protein
VEEVPEQISFPEMKSEPDENCNDLQSGLPLKYCRLSRDAINQHLKSTTCITALSLIS